MKVLIMSDMEGVSGIVTWSQVMSDAAMYQAGRRLYTEEINAAVRGALAAGATEIVAVDCHGAGEDASSNHYLPELLHPEVQWVAHHTWGRYTELLEQGCDACLLVGAHARANTPDGVLNHTISTTTWRNLWFNDDLVGESGINAALCGHYGVPVLLVTGDTATCKEVSELLGDGLTTVAVKHGLSRYSARQIAPVKAREMVEAGAKQALQNLKAVKPYVPAQPTTITIDLSTADTAQPFRNKPNVEITDDDMKVISRGATWMEAWDNIWPA